jgi:hypothetical protein
MIQRYSHLICVLAFVGLWVPLIGNLMNPVAAPLPADNRTIATFPGRPASLVEWLNLPGDLESYTNDNFGFRHQMVAAHSTLRFVLRSPVVGDIAFGENGWMFYTRDMSFQQSRGQILRHERLRAFADLAAELDTLISARGGQLMVAVPPNQHTIGAENLPSWALRFDGPTEYDVVMRMLAERKVEAIDLRPVLHAGKTVGPVYRPRDTHWSNLGALLAFNAIVQALEHDDWIIDPAHVYRGTREEVGGLARMAGVPTIFMDTETDIALDGIAPAGVVIESLDDFPPLSTYVMTTSNRETPISIVGDSFTRSTLRDYFAARSSRLFWTHFRHCEFDWKLVEQNLPSIVLLMPTERLLGCDPQKKPRNLPIAG